jgi:NAD+ kinase
MATRPKFIKLGLVANVRKLAVRHAVTRVYEVCAEFGIRIFAEPEAVRAFKIPSIKSVPKATIAKHCDLILSLGGDGTMLTSARLAAPFGVPVLGINMGTLGFITPVPYENMEEALRQALRGKFAIERRSMLRAEIYRSGRIVERRIALNDIVVLRGSSAKLAELETKVDGRVQATYKADGLIIATPTGSTAYALSAGAPVLAPQSRTLVIAPISPHTLSVRPLVLDDTAVIDIQAPRSRSPLSFSTDGESGFWLKAQDRIRISRYAKDAILLVPPDYDYWEILRSKLGWRGN